MKGRLFLLTIINSYDDATKKMQIGNENPNIIILLKGLVASDILYILIHVSLCLSDMKVR